MSESTSAHGRIEQVFPNIFYVAGTNQTSYQGTELIHSRNMIIVRQGAELILINTMRLNDAELKKLDSLGQVKHVMRIGSFHGRDDLFYLEKYQANYWILKGMDHRQYSAVYEINAETKLPLEGKLFQFETSIHPEAVLHIPHHQGVLITCDSLKNWDVNDDFFSPQTKQLYQDLGFLGPAVISSIWLEACQVQPKEFENLLKLEFKHLISAHGKPLLNNADKYVRNSVANLGSRQYAVKSDACGD